MSKKATHKGKISTTNGEEVFGLSPFTSLSSSGLPETTQKSVSN